MPTIYDNIENQLASALKDAFNEAYKADICVGYFNLRGWNHFAKYWLCKIAYSPYLAKNILPSSGIFYFYGK